MKFLKKFKCVYISFLLCFAIPFVLFFVFNQFIFSNNYNTFSQGSIICGVDVSGLSKIEAEEKLNNYFENETTPINLSIKYQDKEWSFKEEDFQIKTNIHTIIDNFYKSNRKKGYFNKKKTINKANKMGFSSDIIINYAFLGIDEKIEQICSQIEYPAIDSKIEFNKKTNNLVILPSKTGVSVDKQKLYNDIISKIQTDNNITIEIETTSILPNITEDVIKKATVKQSQFSTSYANSNSDRKNNIRIATQTLNGFCINPNEEFSFNEALGKRSEDKGYKQANIIKDGAFVKGVGGGVCQVSTTLYNALLLANIDVTEVHKHSLPVSYVKPALDAMVSWDSADLKFKNTTDLPIFILTNCDGRTLTFSIYGDTKSPNLEIKTTSEITKKIPHKGDKIIQDIDGLYSDKVMFKGEFYRTKYPKDGYEANAYLEYYIDGKFSHKKQIRHSSYDQQQGIVYEGCDILPEGMSLPKDKYTELPLVI